MVHGRLYKQVHAQCRAWRLYWKLPLKLANSVAPLACFCRVVELTPMWLCRPHRFRRAPRTAVT